MKKKYIIFGINYFAEMIAYYVERYDDVDVVAYTVDEQYKETDSVHGKPLIAFERLEEFYSVEDVFILNCLGYKKMNSLRRAKYEEIKRKGYKVASFIHPSTVIEKSDIGEGNIIFENVNIGYSAKIGNGNILWNGALISHHCEIGDYNFLSGSTALAGKVTIKNNCFLGVNCTVKGGVCIDEYTLVGAGCYLSKSTIAGGVYVPERFKYLEGKTSIDFL